MTREEARQMLPILTAYAEGKTIEYLEQNGQWRNYHEFYDFTHSPQLYRIKPEPREFWIHKGHIDALRHEPCGTKAWIFNSGNPSEYVRVREVLE